MLFGSEISPPCASSLAVPEALLEADAAQPRTLLAASPPIPIGRKPGIFQFNLSRYTTTQPLGMSFTQNERGVAVIAEDYSHYGLQRGDEVVGIGKHEGAQDLKSFLAAIDWALDFKLVISRDEGLSVGDEDSRAPMPRCMAHSFPMRKLLQVEGPTRVAKGVFCLEIIRATRKVSFGLRLCLEDQLNSSDMNERTPSQNLGFGTLSSTTKAYSVKSTSVGSLEDPTLAGNSPSLSRSSSQQSLTSSVELRLDQLNDAVVAGDASSCANGAIRGNSSKAAQSIFGRGRVQDSARRGAHDTVASEAEVEALGSVVVREDVHQYGVMRGDVLVRINGSDPTSLAHCLSLLRTCMTLRLEFRRPGSAALQAESVDVVDDESWDLKTASKQRPRGRCTQAGVEFGWIAFGKCSHS